MKSNRRPNKAKASLGESIYLFVWALLKSSKEVFIDFAHDILDSFSSNQRKNKRLKSSTLYWTKLQRQMGILEEEKKSSDNKKTENSLESLENEIMNLKLELESFTSPRGTKRNLLDTTNITIEKVPSLKGPPLGTPAPPGPPPPPPNSTSSSFIKPKKEIKKEVEKEQPKKQHTRTESITTDSLQAAAKLLRKTKPKSPEPSPKKAPQMAFQNDLFNAIKLKFKKVIEVDDDSKHPWSGYNSPQRKSSFSGSPKPKELVASQDETSKAIENTQKFLNFEDLESNSIILQNKI